MSTARRIAKNTTVLFLSQMITYLMGFFITMYTARYLGAAGFGVLSLALALTGIFSVATDLGLGTLTVREVSRDKSLADQYLSNTLTMRLLLTLLTFGLIAITVNIIGYPLEVKYVTYMITASFFFGVVSGILFCIFQAYQKMEYQSIASLLNSAVMLIGTFLAIYYQLNILFFALLYVLSNATVMIYMLITYSRNFPLPKPGFDLDFWKRILLEALPLSVISIFGMLIFKIDTVILSIMKDELAVGFYNAAYRLMEALLFFPAVYTTSIFPLLSSMYISSKKPLKTAYVRSFKYLTILSLPIAVGTTLLADKIILLIYKSAFIPSILTLQILIWVLPFSFLNYVLGSLLTSMNRQYTVMKITMVCVAFNVILNLIIIPYYSFLGAALATVLTEALNIILSYYIVSQILTRVKIARTIIRPIIACVVMAVVLLYVDLNIFLEILIGTITYFTVLIGLKTFTPEDYELFRQIIHRPED